MDAKRLAEALKKLDDQNFGPNDSYVASAINHPVTAGEKFIDWLAKQVNTAAGIPDQYDNPNPLFAPSPEKQVQAAFDVAGMAQLGALPFAPRVGKGTLGTMGGMNAAPDNLNESILQKYLTTGKLSPEEMAQYEANAVLMRDSKRQHLNVANADAQGGTAMDRALVMGFDTDAYHGTNYPGFDEFMTTGADYSKTEGTGAFFSNNPDLASSYTDIDYPQAKPFVYPVKLKLGKTRNINANGANWDDVRGKTTDELTKSARNSGKYESVRFKNVNDAGMGGYDIEGDTIAIFNPNQIRSRFAAFDPLRKDSSDLLASWLLPATMLGYGMYNEKPDNRSLAEALRGWN